MPAGRPTKFSTELADLICQRICDGQSVREICRDEEMPAMSTVFRWLAEKTTFQEQYARAKGAQGEYYAEEILDIADDGTNDWVERKGSEGQSLGWVLNGEHVQRSRLRVDSRKWLLSKLLPKKYGDKIEIDQTVTQKPAEVDWTGVESEDVAIARDILARATSPKPSADKSKLNGQTKH